MTEQSAPTPAATGEGGCHRCGAQRPERSLTWLRESTGGRVTWLCPDCARRHVHDIEAQLAPEWW